MKGLLAFLLCLTLASGFVLRVDEDDLQWKAWKSFHGKSYLTESEEAMRKAIWRDNLKVRYGKMKTCIESEATPWVINLVQYIVIFLGQFHPRPRESCNEVNPMRSAYP